MRFSSAMAVQVNSNLRNHFSTLRNHAMERCFFGSRYGKNQCDARGDLVKRQAEKFVKSRKGTGPDAKALYEFCTRNLTQDSSENCCHKKRVFFYMEKIERDTKPLQLQTVKGTQMIHDVKTFEPGVVKGRELTFFCSGWIGVEKSMACINDRVVGPLEIHTLHTYAT